MITLNKEQIINLHSMLIQATGGKPKLKVENICNMNKLRQEINTNVSDNQNSEVSLNDCKKRYKL